MVLVESGNNAAPRAGHCKMEKNSSSGNNNINNNDIHRPTEAQLRWAQFHHKSRGQAVKERVERLWHTPLEVKDVDGAFSEDGASSCSENSSDSLQAAIAKLKSRPKISRGRRALLKVSQRGYEKRRAFIQEQGFQCSGNKENEVQVEQRDEEDARKLHKRRVRDLPNADEARKQRFEVAYATMKNLNPSQRPIVVRPTKRWTRPKVDQSANESPGTNYQDWKWGLARRKRTADGSRLSRMTNMPFDRRASWLVHVPARESSASSRRYKYRQPISSEGKILEPVSLYEGQDFCSPGQLKFEEMISRLQNYDDAPVQEHKYTNVSARYLNSLPTSEPIESPRVVRRQRHQIDSSLERPSESETPQIVRRQSESIGARYEREFLQHDEEDEPLNIARRSRSSIGDKYVQYLSRNQGRVSEAHSVLTIGSVESDFFEKARRMHGATHLDYGVSDSSRTSRQISVLGAIPESSGHPHRVMRSMRYEDEMVDAILQVDERHVSSLREEVNTYRRQSDMEVSIDSRATSTSSYDLQTPRTQSRERGALLDFATPGSDIDEMDRSEIAATPVASSFHRGVTKVTGGLFNMITARSISSSDDGSEIRAVAAFRETQKDRRGNDVGSTSTSSSFHGLPEGIRRMVLSGGTSSQQELKQRFASTYSSVPATPERLSPSRSTTKSLSPEHGKRVHQKLMEDSVFLGENGVEQVMIDTDDTTSDASGSVMDAATAATLMMSPTILTKRHQQAVKAIERRHWEQITYLLSANPWLAEMMEVTTQQYLLHKIALYGASKFLWSDENDAVDVIQAAPQQLNEDILRMFPSSVHKFDQDGNLPLHMAAASGNIEMAILLGERFPSGASVRNNDGMLPLHLAVQACSTPLANASGEMVYGADFVALILQLFPGAVAVADGEGDLPLHIAAAALEGEVGVDVIYLLLDEADRQAQSEGGLRFIEKVRSKIDDDSVDEITVATENPTDVLDDEDIHCTMVRNDMGRNALTKAIEAGSGWQVIEALVRGPGGVRAALMQDAHKCNSLHLLLSEEFGDPQAALSILKVAPATATVRNADRMLPVEIACRNEMPDEVILAMVLVDSPVDLSRKDKMTVKKGFGGSWWFLVCESDDQYVELVEEVVSICNYEHLRELCRMKNTQGGDGSQLLSRATPMCRQVLEEALTFGLTTAKAADRLYNV